MSAKQFCQIIGIVLLLVGIVGFLMPGIGDLLTFPLHHNLVHLLSGAVLAYLGFMGSAAGQKMGARVFGIVYGAVTVWGFLGNQHLGPLVLDLNSTYNVIHLVITALALWAGFGRK